jgi:hypothetical protein
MTVSQKPNSTAERRLAIAGDDLEGLVRRLFGGVVGIARIIAVAKIFAMLKFEFR